MRSIFVGLIYEPLSTYAFPMRLPVKQISLGIIGMILLAGGASASSAANSIEQPIEFTNWPIPPNTAEFPQFKLGSSFNNMIVLNSYGPINTLTSNQKCGVASDPACIDYAKKFPGQNWGLSQELTLCTNPQHAESCIEDFQILIDGKSTPTTRVGTVPKAVVTEMSNFGLPYSGQPTLWRDPIVSDPDIGYMLTLTQNVKGSYRNSKSTFYGSALEVVRYKKTSEPDLTQLAAKTVGLFNSKFSSCVWIEVGMCARRLAMPSNISFKIKARLSNQYSGWVSGRMSNAEVDISKFNSRLNLISIAASPVTVPFFAASIPCGGDSGVECDKYRFIYTNHEGGVSQIDSHYVSALADKATINLSQFKIETSGQNKVNKCKFTQGKIAGLASSNATLFPVTQPEFKDGSLNYKIAALHFDANGDVFIGKYELLIENEYAKCLWNLRTTSPKAQITILNEKGKSTISTVATKLIDGYYLVQINGFTFSSPQISVKLN